MTETTDRGSFALVSYVPEPLAGFLHEIRLSLPGDHHPRPHVTLLPPRPLRVSPAEVGERLVELLYSQKPFDIEFRDIHLFPTTNVIYVDVHQGRDELVQIHASLNTGDLAHEEAFEFRPHLTISGPCDPARLESALENARKAWDTDQSPRSFELNEIVFLWLQPGTSRNEWRRLWTYAIGQESIEEENLPNLATALNQKSSVARVSTSSHS